MRARDIIREMKIYHVGGSVRDNAMGKEYKDLDYLIVGATAADIEQMKAQGFKQVGADFPVFLHPDTGDEYALARTERKTGTGYLGFETIYDDSVSLEDDLSRRDFTFNAMARDPETGETIDPHGGQEDIKKRIIRHVSDAFAEDPLRVLRAARFAARFDFEIAPETQTLMKYLADSGELKELTPERVWKEVSRAVMEKYPENFFKVLNKVGAIDDVFPGTGDLFKKSQRVLVKLANNGANEVQRWMGIFLSGDASAFTQSNWFPGELVDGVNFTKLARHIDFSSSESIMKLLNGTRSWQDQKLFNNFAGMMGILEGKEKHRFDLLAAAIEVGKKINFKDLSDQERAALKGPDIGKAIAVKRREIIQRMYVDQITRQ